MSNYLTMLLAATSAAKGMNATKSANSTDELKKQIEELEKQLQSSVETPKVADTPEFEKLEYNAPSDEEIKKQAQLEHDNYVNQNTNAIKDNYESLQKEYEKQLNSQSDSYEKTQKEIQAAYENAKENVNNEVLKRGLARSSIAVNAMEALSGNQAQQLSGVSAQYNQEIQSINSEIDSLNTKLERALNDFNIAAAAKLTEQINSLIDNRDKKQSEVIKYNNQLLEKTAELERDKSMKESDLLSEKYSQIQKEKELNVDKTDETYKRVYYALDEYFSTLSQKEARELLINDSFFKTHLNDYYYYKLFDRYGRN